MNEKELIAEFQTYAWKFWGGRGCPCIKCWRPSVTLHEIKPRSIYREWYTDVQNSVPICEKCHRWAHAGGHDARKYLWDLVAERVEAMGNEDIHNE